LIAVFCAYLPPDTPALTIASRIKDLLTAWGRAKVPDRTLRGLIARLRARANEPVT
jgi:hypothetical protein